MSTSTTTYNVIIKRFEDFATAHPLINRFTYGTIQEGDIGKSCTYPWMHVAPSSTNYDEGQRGMSFDILFADLVRDKDDKPENEKEIISDCSQLFEDLLATIENNTLFGDNALLQKPITITPFLNSFTNNLTGVEGTVTIELDYTFDFCSVPVDFNLNIPTSGGQGGGVLTFDDSLNLSGTSVTLDNDVDTPGNDYYYGTDATGTKGWYTLPTGGGTPSGPAGGDLTGTYPDPTVHRVHGVDFQSGTPSDNEVWIYKGSAAKWQHQHVHASEVTNDSQVNGTNVDDALDHLHTTKEPTITAGTTSQYWRGDKSWQTLYNTSIQSSIIGTTITVQASPITRYHAIAGAVTSSTVAYQVPLPMACTISNFHFRTYGTQPNNGSFVATIQKNGVDTAITITIAAGSAANTFLDTTNSATFAANDTWQLKVIQNAITGASPTASSLGTYSFKITM